MDAQIHECHRKNLCFECDDKKCWHSWELIADCPLWKCNREGKLYGCPYHDGNRNVSTAECSKDGKDDALELLKEQEEEISNYKEVVENLLQQLQDINKYMTPIGMVSDVRAYIEGREQPEIIRCYACKHGEEANDVYLCGKSRGFGLAHEPNWFCADGERKET